MNYFVITTVPEKRNALSDKIKASNLFVKKVVAGVFMQQNKEVEFWESTENVIILPGCILYNGELICDQLRRESMSKYIKSFISEIEENDDLYLLIHSRDIYLDISLLESKEELTSADIFYSIHKSHTHLFRFHHDKRMGFQIFRKPIDRNYCPNLISMFQ